MRPTRSLLTTLALFASAIFGGTVAAQDPEVALEAKPVTANAPIRAVTLYLGRAAVTRSAELELAPGLYDVRFENLPQTVQPQTIQARASGPVNVLGVDYTQEAAKTASAPETARLDAEIEQLQLQLKELAENRELLKTQEDFINAVSIRAAGDATKEAGSADLDLDSIRKQAAFIAEERARLLTARRELDKKQKDLESQHALAQARRNAIAGNEKIDRVAVVSVTVTESTQAKIDLTYLVAEANWEPAYNVRAAADSSSATVEYDAVLTQRTGEDWDDVKLTLSTAQPTVAANPPSVEPWFVDVYVPPPAVAAHVAESAEYRRAELADADKRPPPPAAMPMEAEVAASRDDERFKKALESYAASAAVGGGGPSVTFELPRAITVKTTSQKQQRTRIATIDTQAEFVHVAVPMLTESVYIRGDLKNASDYQLLPGRASIFVGQDYVGPTTMASVPPKGDFKMHFGIDQAVQAKRQLVRKNTESTGLLGGGRRTAYSYRLNIENGASKPITVEVWDRYPVSRSDDIQIELVDLSDALATDAQYVNEERPMGMLKWLLRVPANATGKSASVITYGVRIDRAKDVEMTALPE